MDNSSRHISTRILASIRSRIQTHQERSRKVLGPALMGIVGCTLAWAAYQETLVQGATLWQGEHPPHAKFVRAILVDLGWRPAQGVCDVPYSESPRVGLWIKGETVSEARAEPSVCYFADDEKGEFYQRRAARASPTGSWRALPSGWAGLDALRILTLKHPVLESSHPQTSDPRELRY